MTGKLEKLTLWVLTLIFSGVAILGLLMPEVLFGPTGVVLNTSAVLSEIRAAYFGLFATAAWLLYQGATQEAHRTRALGLAVLILGGFTLGRLVSWGLDGGPEAPVAIGNLVAESVGFVLTLVLWKGRRKGTS